MKVWYRIGSVEYEVKPVSRAEFDRIPRRLVVGEPEGYPFVYQEGNPMKLWPRPPHSMREHIHVEAWGATARLSEVAHVGVPLGRAMAG